MNARRFQQAVERSLLAAREEHVLTTRGANLSSAKEREMGLMRAGAASREARQAVLARRTRRVSELMADGLGTMEIAQSLGLSERQVRLVQTRLRAL